METEITPIPCPTCEATLRRHAPRSARVVCDNGHRTLAGILAVGLGPDEALRLVDAAGSVSRFDNGRTGVLVVADVR